MSRHIERAEFLLQLSRPELAEEEVRRLLADKPDSPQAHTLLARCLLHSRKKSEEALESAKAAVRSAPDWAYGHYILAFVLRDSSKPAESESAIREAIRLDADNGNYFGFLGDLEFCRNRHAQALETAKQGLRVQPANTHCLKIAALALYKLQRFAEAQEMVENALRSKPEDARAHAIAGDISAKQRDYQRAMVHFREALRAEPGLDWARVGLLDALKDHYLISSMVLRLISFTRLVEGPPLAILMTTLGLCMVYMIVLGFAAFFSPAVERDQGLWCAWGAVGALGFFLWHQASEALFSLVLRLNPLGRLALTTEQVGVANAMGVTLLAALAVGLTIYWQGTSALAGTAAAIWMGFQMFPIAAVHRCPAGWRRGVMRAYAATSLLCTVLSFGLFLWGQQYQSPAMILLGGSVLGLILTHWAVTVLNAVDLAGAIVEKLVVVTIAILLGIVVWGYHSVKEGTNGASSKTSEPNYPREWMTQDGSTRVSFNQDGSGILTISRNPFSFQKSGPGAAELYVEYVPPGRVSSRAWQDPWPPSWENPVKYQFLGDGQLQLNCGVTNLLLKKVPSP